MIQRFPHDTAYLPRTRLSYVNLPGILSDGKRDRTARVAGFVAIQLGERCYLVFLKDGEPFHSARLHPDHRAPVALAEVIRLAATESERGEGGQIAYFGAGEEQLRAMLATLVQEPVRWEEPLDPARPDLFFPRLRERRFTGVLELCEGGRHHYLAFDDGVFRGGWFTDRDGAVAVGDFVRALFERGERLACALFPALPELPVQAPPGLVDLYRRIVGGTMRELAQVAGRESSLALMRRAQAVVAAEHPLVGAFRVTDEGRIAGDPVATPETLTAGAAAWLTETLVTAAEHLGVDPAGVVERVARDSRFVLSELGFFARLPWALAL